MSKTALLWAGVVIGCSFIATPAKFLAPSLSLATALEVGRATFRVVVVAELFLALLCVLFLLRLSGQRFLVWIAIGALGVQWLLVMPQLSVHTDAVIQGAAIGGSSWHWVYIGLEVLKVLMLLFVGLSRFNPQTR
ncbi:MAG: hypothetical protein JJT85_02025 [Chromatiales bacterium]|nr:hypothetical protein [Chromatiales bacterium]